MFLPGHGAVAIDAVYFAQTHVQQADDLYPTLVSGREALIKAHVVDPTTPAAPPVTAELSLGGATLNLSLSGPGTLPASIPDGPGVVQHDFANSFTATIPAAWVQPGLTVTVTAGAVSTNITTLDIGAPTRVIMTMTDIHFFEFNPGDYPVGWDTELAAKWPVAELDVRRADDVVFHQLVIPPRSGAPAARVTSAQDYVAQTGIGFDGENSAATEWNVALRRAGGRSGGYSLYYLNKYNVSNEGVAGGFSGVGTGYAYSIGILHHELGHALSLPHWGDSAAYPYKGAMFGINPPVSYNETHAGPTWAFDQPTQTFIPCTVQPNNVTGKPTGTYKVDPMQGGGTGFQEAGFIYNHFSDYSVNRMRSYLANTVVAWNDSLGSYAKWNAVDADYTNPVSNDGVKYPLLRDQNVISVIAATSGASPEVNMVYPPIGPYTAGLIQLFDPRNAVDRAAASASSFVPAEGCDYSLRLMQGGVEKVYMLAASNIPGADPLNANSLITEGVNLPADDGPVTRVELLSTPDAEVNGLPVAPEVLYSWALPVAPAQGSFDVAPTPLDSSSITMTADIGTFSDDSNGSIEYYFTETSGNPGGDDSGWQSNPTYIDSGLQASTEFRYTVTMRSAASGEVGLASAESAATTLPQSAVKTILTARGGTNSWLDDTWTAGPPLGNIDAEIAPGIGSRSFDATNAWTGSLLLDTGSSLDARGAGTVAIQSLTHLTMRSAAIYDHFGSSVTFPSMTISGGSFFQCNNYSFDGSSDKFRTFSGVIEGDGGFRVRGHRRMSYAFGQSNTFTGGLALQAGERYLVPLNAAQAAGLGDVTLTKRSADDRSAVIVLGADDVFHPGATLTLNGKGWNGFSEAGGWEFSGRFTALDMNSFNATVARLIVNGVEMPPGDYPGTADSGDWIDGSGILTVTGAADYFAWIAGYPGVGAETAFVDDADGDGIYNGIENYLGSDPAVFSAGLHSQQLSGNVASFTHGLNPLPASDIVADYLWTSDLVNYFGDGESDGSGTSISFSQGSPGGGEVSVTANISGPVPDDLFFVIRVTQLP